jgi:hypothetical protein
VGGHRRFFRHGKGRQMGAPERSFRLAVCPCCQRSFAICCRCDRGHVYCSRRCSWEARQESLRQARRRHRRSPEGRLDHRDRERERRRRRRCGRRVGDHPSEVGELRVRVTPSSRAPSPSSANGAGAAAWEAPDAQPTPFVVQRVAASSLCCAVCGRLGRWWRAGPALRRPRPRARARAPRSA